MKKRNGYLKLMAVLFLLAMTNLGLEDYPLADGPECESCDDNDDDDFPWRNFSVHLEPAWLSLFPGETAAAQATCSHDTAKWTVHPVALTDFIASASAAPGPAASSTLTVSTRSFSGSSDTKWAGRCRYADGTVFVYADVNEGGSFSSSRTGKARLEVLGLIDQIDTVAAVGADPGGTGWVDLQVTKRRYSSSPGEWTFSTALVNPGDSEYITGLNAVSTGKGTARVTFAAAADIAPPAWCNSAFPYCTISVPINMTATKAGGGGFSVTETGSISVVVKMPD